MSICKYCENYELDKRYCTVKSMYTALDTNNDCCEDYKRVCDEDMKKRAIGNLIEGKKYDEGKNRMGLVLQGFSNALWEVGRVGTFGCSRYGENNWQYLDNAKSRYLDALCRHLFQHLQGNKVDEDSGLLHLQHMAWNALALLEFELKESEDKDG